MKTSADRTLRQRRKYNQRRGIILFFNGIVFTILIISAFIYFNPLKITQVAAIRSIVLQSFEKQVLPETTDSVPQEPAPINNLAEQKKEFLKGSKISSNTSETLSNTIEKLVNQTDYSGTFLVFKNNQIILEQGFNYANKNDKLVNETTSTYMLGSVQKSITATMIMLLVEEGKLALTDTVDLFYPTLPNSQKITIDQLLSMTSGYTQKKPCSDCKTSQDVINYALKNIQYTQPTSWSYSAVNYTLLGSIIAQLSGISYEEFFNERIKKPLELSDTGFYSDLTPESNLSLSYEENDLTKPVQISNVQYVRELGTGNMYMSCRDLMIYYKNLIDGTIISKDSLKDMWTLKPESFSYTYKSGTYHKKNGLYAHGVFNNFEETINMTTDGTSGVISLSNIYHGDKRIINLTKQIFETTTETTLD